jgi:hypothetical protein
MRQIERVVAAALAGVVVSGAAAQDAVRWRVEDGGNGHWYKASARRMTWPAAREECLQLSADLACPKTSLECDFLRSIFPRGEFIMLVGLYQDLSAADYTEPAGGWRWVSGDLVDSELWQPGEPNNYFGDERYGELEGPSNQPYLNDVIPGANLRFFIEWSADCNGDGIVDYGQILDGTYPDEDGNGVPDCCDADEQCDPCIGDLNGDGVIGPPDLGILLAVWGTDGGDIVAADINGDGTVNASDLGPLLGAWGVCP